MQYGALTKELEVVGLFPYPVAPYTGLYIGKLFWKMHRIRSPAWCHLTPHGAGGKKHPCDLHMRVMAIAEKFISSAGGLDLKDFEAA